MFLEVAPNTTFCPNTPDNWRNFHHLKDAVTKPTHRNPLTGQITKENQRLRQLSAFLPGHEPDRAVL